MRVTSRFLMSIAAMAASAVVFATQAQADVKVGVLSCGVDKGWGVIFGSSRDLRCTFDPAGRGAPEHYYGSVSKFGIDIGYTSGGVIVWEVLAPTADRFRPGALEGTYGGATVGATIGVGGAINALIGGFDRSFILQPVSFEGNKGLNVAAGIGSINLRHEHGDQR